MRKGLCGIFSVLVLVLAGCASDNVKRTILDDGRIKYDGSTASELKEMKKIRGHVKSVDLLKNRPVPGATVEVKNENLGVGYYRLTTDSDGYFEIEGFEDHIRYIIEVSAPGFISTKYTTQLTGDDINIQLDRAAVLSGIVFGSDYKPLSDVEVQIASGCDSSTGEESGSRRAGTTQTSSDGKYIFGSVSSGSYVVTFHKDGYITQTARIEYIQAGETFKLPMRLFKKSSVSGKIVSKESGAPAINVQLSLSGRVEHYATTYADGSYCFEDVKPGKYKLSLSHQGFYSADPVVIKIVEGKSSDGFNFELKPREPQLEVSAYRYTFVPGSKVEFSIKSLRLDKIKNRIYRVPPSVLIRGRVDPNKLDPKAEKFTVVKEWDDLVKDFQPYEWRYQAVEMNDALPEGGYCMEVSGADRVFSRKFFTVTSVGLVVKRSRDSVFAYVSNLVTNKPVANADIVVFDNTPEKKIEEKKSCPEESQGEESSGEDRFRNESMARIENLPVTIIQKGKTDASGIYHQPLKNSLQLSVLAVSGESCFAFCNTGSPVTFSQEETKYFIYTDRPVYRAGDKVNYKIIAKKRTDKFDPLASQKIYYEISNRDTDTVVTNGEAALDEWGTFHSELSLDAECSLGEYEIRTGTDKADLYGAGKFYVEQYRKPEFSVDVTPMKTFYANDDTAEFKIEAKYYFGAPLKAAQVKYRFYEKRLRDTDTRYWWEDEYQTHDSYDRIRDEGARYLDDNGIGVVRLSCGKFPYDREITAEVTIVDESNISITSRSTVRIGRGDFYIKINPSKNFFGDSEYKPVALKTVAQDGVPVSSSVDIKVYRYIWKPWERVYVHDKRPLLELTATTDAKGDCTFALPKKFDQYGEFDIVVTGKDRKGNYISASQVVWVYSSQTGTVDSRLKNLELVLSETDLSGPGEITGIIKSRFQDAYVCITLEGKDVYDSFVVQMKGNITPIRIPIKGAYAPNLYVTATMQRNRALFVSTVGVSLPNPDSTLAISLMPDKKKYLPGEKATITVKAADDSGKPVKADISLGVVDEAIYAIRPDHTPKMKDFFYTKISNWVLTSYSYPMTVLAGAAKEGKIKIRDKFKDTAFWSANIRTDANGSAVLSFTLPDNLTTWRMTARGHDMTGRVGEKRGEFLVTQDLVARIGKPRFFIEGDTVGLLGIVTSNAQRGMSEVKTKMSVDGTVVEPDRKVQISLPPFGSSSAQYTVNIPEGKDALSVQFEARDNAGDCDGLKHTIPVLSRGTPYSMFAYGDLTGSRTVTLHPLESTDDFEVAPDELVITVNPNPIAVMLASAKYLSEYPYGCVEQTISRFLPNLALKKILEKKGYSNAYPAEDLEGKINLGLTRLIEMQNDDGTWGWWSGDRGNEFLTAYVLYGLYLSKQWGYAIDNGKLENGLSALKRFVGSADISCDARSYVFYVNALWGGWSQSEFKELAENSAMSPYSLAYLIRAAAASRNGSLSKDIRSEIDAAVPQLVASLKALEKKDSCGPYWENTDSYQWSWQGSRTEITAQVLAALSESGDATPLAGAIVSSLCRRNKGGSYLSTKETSSVILAFCTYLEKHKVSEKPNGNMSTLSFKLDGKEICTVDCRNDVPSNPDLVKRIKLDRNLRKSIFTVEAAGSGDPAVFFDVALKGFLYYKDKGISSFLSSEGKSLNKLENGISLSREFRSIRRVRDMNNREYMVPQPFDPKARIKVGDEIFVKIRFQAHDNFEFLMLQDYLPAGCEVTTLNTYEYYSPYTHQERWDDRMVYFFTQVEKEAVYELSYIIRAELSGEFTVKPTRMECMYEPSIQGWAVPGRFKVNRVEEEQK